MNSWDGLGSSIYRPSLFLSLYLSLSLWMSFLSLFLCFFEPIFVCHSSLCLSLSPYPFYASFSHLILLIYLPLFLLLSLSPSLSLCLSFSLSLSYFYPKSFSCILFVPSVHPLFQSYTLSLSLSLSLLFQCYFSPIFTLSLARDTAAYNESSIRTSVWNMKSLGAVRPPLLLIIIICLWLSSTGFVFKV